jgi:hypothetical protein
MINFCVLEGLVINLGNYLVTTQQIFSVTEETVSKDFL